MKNKKSLSLFRTIFLLCMVLMFSVTVLASESESRWDYTITSGTDGTVIAFADVQVTIPGEWNSKVQMAIGSNDVRFYHIETHTDSDSGLLLTIGFTEDEADVILSDENIIIIGAASDGIYYAVFESSENADTSTEYGSFLSELDSIKTKLAMVLDTGSAVTSVEITTPASETEATAESETTMSSSDDEYIFPQSSTAYLTESDLVGMTTDEIQMAINEIYARHGRKFSSSEVQAYFDAKSWYTGTINPQDFYVRVFNEYEKANVNLMAARIAVLNSGTSASETAGITTSSVTVSDGTTYNVTSSGTVYSTETTNSASTVYSPSTDTVVTINGVSYYAASDGTLYTISSDGTINACGTLVTNSSTSVDGSTLIVNGTTYETTSDYSSVYQNLYSPDDYFLPQSSYSYLTSDDIAGFTLEEVQLAINEIYARYGRKFITDEIQTYFDSKSWYSGTIEADDFDPVVFNIYEATNVNLLVTRREALS